MHTCVACTVQVSRGLSLVAAGSLVASNDAIAMVLLPPLCLLSRLCGLKPLLVGASANHTHQLIACGLHADCTLIACGLHADCMRTCRQMKKQ